tara:strand:- start:295 stop:1401 length:1107 start_codon:yes stop_codon:yes gene_type:complete
MKKFIFINSMSRTGTSLLYQLLYGHPGIFHPPFRIQYACSKPVGFPAVGFDDSDMFCERLLSKTTTPFGASGSTEWSELKMVSLGEQCSDNLSKAKNLFSSYPEAGQGFMTSLRVLNDLLALSPDLDSYYCLQEDHAYVLGSKWIEGIDIKYLTTLRSPFDMLASKKNMLLFHLHGTASPTEYCMNQVALERELVRALFSWCVASYEFSKNKSFYPVLFEHLKGEHRSASLRLLMTHLGLDYHCAIESDSNQLEDGKLYNELLYTGSSLGKITGGKSSKTVGASKVSLSQQERDYICDLVDIEKLAPLLSSTPSFFNEEFDSFWKESFLSDIPALARWMEMYVSGQHVSVFEDYSSYNYGGSNAESAF